MSEILTLTTPVTYPSTITWEFDEVTLSKASMTITARFNSNLGEKLVLRVVSPTGLSFVNQGKFKVNQNKSLEKWLIEQAQLEFPQLAGTITGTEF